MSFKAWPLNSHEAAIVLLGMVVSWLSSSSTTTRVQPLLKANDNEKAVPANPWSGRNVFDVSGRSSEALRGYPGSYAAIGRGYLNGAAGRSLSGASRRNIPRIELIRTQASLDCGVRS